MSLALFKQLPGIVKTVFFNDGLSVPEQSCRVYVNNRRINLTAPVELVYDRLIISPILSICINNTVDCLEKILIDSVRVVGCFKRECIG